MALGACQSWLQNHGFHGCGGWGQNSKQQFGNYMKPSKKKGCLDDDLFHGDDHKHQPFVPWVPRDFAKKSPVRRQVATWLHCPDPSALVWSWPSSHCARSSSQRCSLLASENRKHVTKHRQTEDVACGFAAGGSIINGELV